MGKGLDNYIGNYGNILLLFFFNLEFSEKKLQVLETQIYKIKNGIAPEIMKDIVELQNPSYNLRSSCNQFRRKNKNCSLWFTVRKISWPKNLGTCAK